jgi:hypothetical protein
MNPKRAAALQQTSRISGVSDSYEENDAMEAALAASIKPSVGIGL